MAEVLTKASLVSSWHGSSQRHHRRVSTVPDSCSFVSGVGRFPSLKLKSQILRSWSSSSEFQGKKLLFHVNRGLPNRASSRLRASTAAQVCYIATFYGFYYTLNFNFFFFWGIRTFLLPGVLLICVTCLFPSCLCFSLNWEHFVFSWQVFLKFLMGFCRWPLELWLFIKFWVLKGTKPFYIVGNFLNFPEKFRNCFILGRILCFYRGGFWNFLDFACDPCNFFSEQLRTISIFFLILLISYELSKLFIFVFY